MKVVYKLNCEIYGDEVERFNNVSRAVCFRCKSKNRRIRTEKARLHDVSVISSMKKWGKSDEWLKLNHPNTYARVILKQAVDKI